ncbi:MAG: hypothetical protein DWQ31_12655 [Planctomycetota bacterium]|nr:MAG: hypothetical protein DWQ31_12655 [Planctomycetota bacterium]
MLLSSGVRSLPIRNRGDGPICADRRKAEIQALLMYRFERGPTIRRTPTAAVEIRGAAAMFIADRA